MSPLNRENSVIKASINNRNLSMFSYINKWIKVEDRTFNFVCKSPDHQMAAIPSLKTNISSLLSSGKRLKILFWNNTRKVKLSDTFEIAILSASLG